jgi:hypothetical protein
MDVPTAPDPPKPQPHGVRGWLHRLWHQPDLNLLYYRRGSLFVSDRLRLEELAAKLSRAR